MVHGRTGAEVTFATAETVSIVHAMRALPRLATSAPPIEVTIRLRHNVCRTPYAFRSRNGMRKGAAPSRGAAPFVRCNRSYLRTTVAPASSS